mgnify:CR=1 FL=1
MSVDENGQKTLNVNATDADAEQLAQILKMAGLGGGQPTQGCGCDTDPCSCEQMDEGQDDLANAPDVEMADTDTLVNTIAGGLNKPKRDVAGNGQTTVPVTATRVHEDANIEAQLLNLYKQYKLLSFYKETNNKANIDINLIKIFNEGPDVSLQGSPIVSPTIAAL